MDEQITIPEGCKVISGLRSQMPYQVYYVEGTYAVRQVDGSDRPLR